jgi:hypothetical protein
MAKTKTTKRKAQPSQELLPRALRGKKGVQPSRARLTVGTKMPKTKALLNYDGKSHIGQYHLREIQKFARLNDHMAAIFENNARVINLRCNKHGNS